MSCFQRQVHFFIGYEKDILFLLCPWLQNFIDFVHFFSFPRCKISHTFVLTADKADGIQFRRKYTWYFGYVIVAYKDYLSMNFYHTLWNLCIRDPFNAFLVLFLLLWFRKKYTQRYMEINYMYLKSCFSLFCYQHLYQILWRNMSI